jgi:hypothetical protein
MPFRRAGAREHGLAGGRRIKAGRDRINACTPVHYGETTRIS